MRWLRLSGSWPVQLWASRRTRSTEAVGSGHPRVFTVDAGRPFLTALAEALLAGDLPVPGGMRPDALQLADITLYLPSRRPTRALQEAFLKASGGGALLLPRIKLVGEDSDELELIAAAEGPATGDADIPRAIGELERRLVLTTLVLKWAEDERGSSSPDDEELPYGPTGARTPAQAARLARELAQLIDLMETEGIDFARLRELVPEEYSDHWSRTLAFLEIVMQFWPAHLAERKLLSRVEHRSRLLRAEMQLLKAGPSAAPVIVAGVTAADASASELIGAVLAQPNGALVLPALDQTLDEESWGSIGGHPEHPQFGLKKLIDRLGLS